MISVKDVVRMKIPFPNISSTLARQAHMYICLQDGAEKLMVKCQTQKPKHLITNRPPFRYISETPDISRNPFTATTLIDCDKAFSVDNVSIDVQLLATNRRDICDTLLTIINHEIAHPECGNEIIDANDLINLNNLIVQR
ncbi:hypothetical protein [Bacillus toyonensis]|uniref:hypothetical protein n=1 Tax=Bacillus toyonensis TaxID=155322 RepID=UPI003D64BBF2